jgi:hypothetical protein
LAEIFEQRREAEAWLLRSNRWRRTVEAPATSLSGAPDERDLN